MPAETFHWIPSQPAVASEAPDVLVTKFGDGYEQRSPNGINNLRVSWELSFSKRTDKEGQAILSFLRRKGAVDAFLWRPPVYEAPKELFVARKWEPKRAAPNDMEVRATFERDYSTFIPFAVLPVFAAALGQITLTTTTIGADIYYTYSPTEEPPYPNPDYEEVHTQKYTGAFPQVAGYYKAIAVHEQLRDSTPATHHYA